MTMVLHSMMDTHFNSRRSSKTTTQSFLRQEDVLREGGSVTLQNPKGPRHLRHTFSRGSFHPPGLGLTAE
jgi:hypothetical protein